LIESSRWRGIAIDVPVKTVDQRKWTKLDNCLTVKKIKGGGIWGGFCSEEPLRKTRYGKIDCGVRLSVTES
jgi:hypothetical protein